MRYHLLNNIVTTVVYSVPINELRKLPVATAEVDHSADLPLAEEPLKKSYIPNEITELPLLGSNQDSSDPEAVRGAVPLNHDVGLHRGIGRRCRSPLVDLDAIVGRNDSETAPCSSEPNVALLTRTLLTVTLRNTSGGTMRSHRSLLRSREDWRTENRSL